MLTRASFLKRMAFAALACGLLETRLPRSLRWEPDATAHTLVEYSTDGGQSWLELGVPGVNAPSRIKGVLPAMQPVARANPAFVGSAVTHEGATPVLPSGVQPGDLLVRVVQTRTPQAAEPRTAHSVYQVHDGPVLTTTMAFRGADPVNPFGSGPSEGLSVPMHAEPQYVGLPLGAG